MPAMRVSIPRSKLHWVLKICSLSGLSDCVQHSAKHAIFPVFPPIRVHPVVGSGKVYPRLCRSHGEQKAREMTSGKHSIGLYWPETLAMIFMLGSGVIVASLLAPGARVPIHWSLTGTPDRFASVWVAMLLGPAGLILGRVAIAMRFARAGNPPGAVRWVLLGIAVGLHLFLMAAASERLPEFPDAWLLVLGALLVGVGFRMRSVPPNVWFGIRTPWTLGNKEVWRKTHLAGAWVFGLAGTAMILLPMIISDPALAKGIGLGLLGAAILLSVLLSWWFDRQK